MQTTYALTRLLSGERDQQCKTESREDLDVLNAAGQANELYAGTAMTKGDQPLIGAVHLRPAQYPELSAAWAKKGPARARIRRKFQERGYADSESDPLLSRLSFEVIGKEVPDDVVHSTLAV